MAGAPLSGCHIYPTIDCDRGLFKLHFFMLFSNMDPHNNSSTTDPVNFELRTPIGKETVAPEPSTVKQDPFGDETDAGVKYKTMAWW